MFPMTWVFHATDQLREHRRHSDLWVPAPGDSEFRGSRDATFVPLLQFDNTFQYSGPSPGPRGAHNIKFRAKCDPAPVLTGPERHAARQFTFNASTTAGACSLNVGLANFIVGSPVTITVRRAFKPGYRSWETGYYVQDDWRANRWLTLNLGVRYDIYTPKTSSMRGWPILIR